MGASYALMIADEVDPGLVDTSSLIEKGNPPMPRHRPPYPPKFREQIIALVHAGRSPEELAEEYEPSAVTFRTGPCRSHAIRSCAARG